MVAVVAAGRRAAQGRSSRRTSPGGSGRRIWLGTS
jgi:hypothetical protein